MNDTALFRFTVPKATERWAGVEATGVPSTKQAVELIISFTSIFGSIYSHTLINTGVSGTSLNF